MPITRAFAVTPFNKPIYFLFAFNTAFNMMTPVTIVVTACNNLILSIPFDLTVIITPPVVYKSILQLE